MIVECAHLIQAKEVGHNMPFGRPVMFGACAKCGAEASFEIQPSGSLIGKGLGEPITEMLRELPAPEAPGGELAGKIAAQLRGDHG